MDQETLLKLAKDRILQKEMEAMKGEKWYIDAQKEEENKNFLEQQQAIDRYNSLSQSGRRYDTALLNIWNWSLPAYKQGGKDFPTMGAFILAPLWIPFAAAGTGVYMLLGKDLPDKIKTNVKAKL